MEYIQLGNSNLRVSRICLGCMGFGDSTKGQHTWTLNENQTMEIVKKALESGINFFDTALAYQNGTSEIYLGKALNSLACRKDIIVATKFLPLSQDDINQGKSIQQHIIHQLNQSLENLGMDYIDLYIYHMWDYHASLYDVMECLDSLVKSGKVRYIGISNCFAYQLAQANALAERYGFTKFISVQGHYNLIFREEEREMIKYCHENNIALTPYSALASGRLSKRPGENSKRLKEDQYARFKYDSTALTDQQIIKRVMDIADKHHVSMSEVALAWLLKKVASPVVGATKVTHIEGAVKALNLSLSDEEIIYLEELYVPHELVGVMATNPLK